MTTLYATRYIVYKSYLIVIRSEFIQAKFTSLQGLNEFYTLLTITLLPAITDASMS